MRLPTFDDQPSAVLLDLDGTVFTSTGEVSARTRRSIEAVMEAGVAVVFATARPIRAVAAMVGRELLQTAAVTHINGAVSHDGATLGRPVSHQALAPPVAAHLVELVGRFAPGQRVVIELEGWEFGSNVVMPAEQLWALNRATPEMVLPLADAIDRAVAKVVVRSGESIAPLVAAVDAEIGSEVTMYRDRFDDRFVQFVAPDVSKVSGVQAALRLGEFHGRFLAIGDDLSDLELIRRSRYGVAMGNAHPEVLAAAPYVTAGNDEDGVALVLERLVASLGR